MTFKYMIFWSAIALFMGACLTFGLTKQPMGETTCQTGVNQGLADIPHLKAQIRTLDARITTLEMK
jgi:hypothetical protein